MFDDFGFILPPKLEAKKVIFFGFFQVFWQDTSNMGPRVSRSAPKALKSAQDRPKTVLRATQEWPGVPQEWPWSAQKHPKSKET